MDVLSTKGVMPYNYVAEQAAWDMMLGQVEERLRHNLGARLLERLVAGRDYVVRLDMLREMAMDMSGEEIALFLCIQPAEDYRAYWYRQEREPSWGRPFPVERMSVKDLLRELRGRLRMWWYVFYRDKIVGDAYLWDGYFLESN